MLLNAVITIVNYDRHMFIVQATGHAIDMRGQGFQFGPIL
jgi:hypothetical protein